MATLKGISVAINTSGGDRQKGGNARAASAPGGLRACVCRDAFWPNSYLEALLFVLFCILTNRSNAIVLGIFV